MYLMKLIAAFRNLANPPKEDKKKKDRNDRKRERNKEKQKGKQWRRK
jgi:hypothetical protein